MENENRPIIPRGSFRDGAFRVLAGVATGYVLQTAIVRAALGQSSCNIEEAVKWVASAGLSVIMPIGIKVGAYLGVASYQRTRNT